MGICVIACRTLEQELTAAMKHTGCTAPVFWLEAGQHNRKEARRAEIQAMLDSCGEYDTVLLAMSLCGGCLSGLESRNARLVIPRFDDCITLLLGSQEHRKNFPAAYFLTGGWLAGTENIWAEYRRTADKYGEARAKSMFSAMLANYEKMIFVDTGCQDMSTQIRSIAAAFQLEYGTAPGCLSCLENLLLGNWDHRFLVVPPLSLFTPQTIGQTHTVTLLPENRKFAATAGENLLKALQIRNLAPHAPCGGNGTCGKCHVLVDGETALSCKTAVTRDMTVELPTESNLQILHSENTAAITANPLRSGYLLAFDIGTTTVVGYLLDGITGKELAQTGCPNPQASFGADVISRIRAALDGAMSQLTASIRTCLTAQTEALCREAGISPDRIHVVSVVGNPAMQQLFLGISPKNLAQIPFSPVLTKTEVLPASSCLPICSEALLLTPPDISGYVGADTLGCILSTKLHQTEELTLLVDIGTNGELVLGNKHRMVACATAAGPALEGANIHFGMWAQEGAIDRVWLENGSLCHHVIGGGKALGICGSGLLDAVAVMLDLGLLNNRGRIQNETHIFHLTEDIYLTQEDIRQVQLAKGAVCAGIRLMADYLEIELEQIHSVLLAGAFGSHLNPESACRMGLLPPELLHRITAVGNAAGAGAKLLALDRQYLEQAQEIANTTEFLELANLPDFPKYFGRAMGFTS